MSMPSSERPKVSRIIGTPRRASSFSDRYLLMRYVFGGTSHLLYFTGLYATH